MATLDPGVIAALAHAVAAAFQQQVPQGGAGGGRGDIKSLRGPPEWDSTREDPGFVEWHIKVKAWLSNQDERALRWLNAARDADVVLETDDLDTQSFPDEAVRNACKRFNGLLYNVLVTKLRGEAFNSVSSVRDACCLETWRLLMRR